MRKILDFDAAYSPESRIDTVNSYAEAWPVAESAKYYQKQVSQLDLLDDRQTRRLAYQIQLAKSVEPKLEFARWAELSKDEAYRRIETLVKEGRVAKNQLTTGYLRLVTYVARLTMGWLPYGSNGYKEEARTNGEDDEEKVVPQRSESVFKGNIVADLSVFKTAPLPLEDRIQVGTEGLMEAAEKYDPSSNAKFITYAWWWIESEILRTIALDKVIHIPVDKVEMLRNVRAQNDKLSQELGRSPTGDELSEAVSHIKGINQHIKAKNADSVAAFHQLDESTYDRTDLTESEIVEQIMREEAVDKALETLPERERDIIAMRYGFVGGEPMTLEEIGSQIGATRERVRQLEYQALGRLAAYVPTWN
ncbi:MAG TPA: sigma-70 family RNA polymerase sigma factor [Candidatus Saccharimonadales bacterium]|nr:sigma-70 family RNA polymerase sigma factor [Candidatus Saccharimonadales bacterium]